MNLIFSACMKVNEDLLPKIFLLSQLRTFECTKESFSHIELPENEQLSIMNIWITSDIGLLPDLAGFFEAVKKMRRLEKLIIGGIFHPKVERRQLGLFFRYNTSCYSGGKRCSHNTIFWFASS